MPASHQNLRRLVRALRAARGWTQERLAEKAGVDYKYYQLFECARTPEPSLRFIGRVAAALGVKPWVLLCDDPALVLERTGIAPDKLPPKSRVGRPRKDGRPPRKRRKPSA
ncbi:MAG: helix-turn-helix domain-containing protein [Opitutaceae bacterium]|jgi:transcriptional regulator with XRE-family HTH domain|nr:helix-turn-helix domain-containing protein [Opitutaceae bacterium]